MEKEIPGLQPNAHIWVRVIGVGKDGRQGNPSDDAHDKTTCAAPSEPPSSLAGRALGPVQVEMTWQVSEMHSALLLPAYIYHLFKRYAQCNTNAG